MPKKINVLIKVKVLCEKENYSSEFSLCDRTVEFCVVARAIWKSSICSRVTALRVAYPSIVQTKLLQFISFLFDPSCSSQWSPWCNLMLASYLQPLELHSLRHLIKWFCCPLSKPSLYLDSSCQSLNSLLLVACPGSHYWNFVVI